MPHITLPDGLPGITGPLAFRPETARPMRAMAEFLLRGPNTLSSADRESLPPIPRARTIVTSARQVMRQLPLTT